MFDIGWTELMVIGVVALIVIGPKDLPDMFRTLGQVTAKLRRMARDFQRAMEQAATDSGVKDVAKDLKSVTSAKGLGIDAVKDAAARFDKWDPLKSAPKPVGKPAASAMAPLGPATQALADAKAAREAAAAAVQAAPPPVAVPVVAPVAAPAPVVAADPPPPLVKTPKPRAPRPKAAAAADAPPKLRAPRKTPKKAEDA